MDCELWKKRRKRPPAMLWMMMVVLLALITSSKQTEEVYQANCRAALGMYSGLIPDSAITASSSYDYKSVGPHNARIRTENNGGAWCPKEMVTRDVYEFLEIDLGGLKVITLVETQGRFGNGQGQEFAEYYLLEYQRANHGTWVRYKDKHGTELFRGNLNTYIAELREVNPPIIARRMRIVPYSRHHRTVCMRVELYGCPWKEGLVSYNMHQGHRRGSGVNLYDYTYDGKIQDGFLSGGIGQLVDGEEGLTNFRLDPQATGKKGYEWIGWKNDSQAAPPVEVRFEFDQVRNFTSMRVHCNNMFTKDVRVFRMAKVYFSVGGLYYTAPPVIYEYMKDTLIEYARNIIIPLHHRVGKFVKLELYYDARWIMLSEIKFESDAVMYEVPAETPPPSMFPATNKPDSGSSPKDKNDQAVMEVRVIKQEKRPLGSKPKEAGTAETTSNPHATEATGAMVKPESQKDKNFKEEHIGIIIGVISALILLLFAVAIFIVLRRRREKESVTNHGFMFEKHKLPCDVNDLKTLPPKVPNYDMYNSMAVSDIEGEEDSLTRLKGAPPAEESHGECSGLLGQTNRENPDDGQKSEDPSDLNGEALFVKLPPEPVFHTAPSDRSSRASSQTPHLCSPPTVPPPPIPPPPNPTALLEVVPDHNPFHGDGTGSAVRASPRSSPATAMMDRKVALVEFPRDSLHMIERLGQGQFGEVELCQVRGGPAEWLVGLPVVVKVLRSDADTVAREHFHREAEILAGLRDPNLAQVVGFCTKSEPMCMVLEYAGLGDLNNFLRQRIPEDADMDGMGKRLSYGAQIYMATQIASGMKYLESLNMVHRDLATRNVLVGEHYAVKISDLGMSRDIYTSDYFCIEGRAMLPIRWMAWECVLLGKFSNKSDVWSFAVTLWEILGFAREQPFCELSDEHVIENCGHYFKQDGQEAYLPQPDICPKEIYDLMHECWNRDELQRPAFREIHMFLQRKNMGYNPVEDAKRSGDAASCGAI